MSGLISAHSEVFTMRNLRFLFFCNVAIILILLIIITSNWFVIKSNYEQFQVEIHNSDNHNAVCRDVLNKLVKGQWIKRETINQTTIDDIQNFMTKARTYHKIPLSLQREDGLCGNIAFGEKNVKQPGLGWFRALCNPDGNSPCCFHNTCMSKSMNDCSCEECSDARQQIHAELYDWVPTDPLCKMIKFTGEQDACNVLRNVTTYFIGDSFMRQLFIAVLSVVRSNKPHGPLKETLNKSNIELCDKYYRVTAECRLFIMDEATECDNTTRMKSFSFWKAYQTGGILKHLQEIEGQPNSWVILDAGIHEHLNHAIVEEKILSPIFKQLAKSVWPKLIWMSVHAPGLLKAHKFKHQQTEHVLKFNHRFNDIMKRKGIPILDFFNMTKGVMSYDGTHYGPGVEDVKAQILFNYFLELRSSRPTIK